MAHRKFAGGPAVRWAEIEVTNELRRLLFKAIEKIAPEVLEDLRTSVWPLYQSEIPERRKGALRPPAFLILHWSRPLRETVRAYARRHSLVYQIEPCNWVPIQIEPCDWVLIQIEQTLAGWHRHPKLRDLDFVIRHRQI